MKLSTAIIAGVALAGAAMAANTASAFTTITVHETYGYGLPGDVDGDFVNVTTDGNLTDVIIGGQDFGAVAAGGASGYFYIGDSEAAGPGVNPNYTVSVTNGLENASGSFVDLLGDADTVATTVTGTLVLASGGPGGVPEPATWALMLLGVGGLGVSLRSSRKTAALAV